MATATEPDISPASRLRRRGNRPAVWALACGGYAGALWAVAWVILSGWDGIETSDRVPAEPRGTFNAVAFWALVGGVLGCPTGPLVWLFRPRCLLKTVALFLLGPIWTSLGFGAATLFAILFRDIFHPLLSSSLAVAAVSAGVGYVGCRMSSRLDEIDAGQRPPSALVGFGWAVSGGATTGAAWLAACVLAHVAFGVTMPFELSAFEGILLVGCGAAYGAAGGALVGMCRPRADRAEAALTLGFLGAVFGALAGIAVVGTVFLDQTYPLITSTLAIIAVGCAAGLCGYQFAPTPATPADEPLDDVDESEAPAVKVEWLLREPKRRWRVGRPLLRVLPVGAVAVGTLVWGAVASNAALCAVAGLGAVVTVALHRQEKRLDALERRSISGRDTRPPV